MAIPNKYISGKWTKEQRQKAEQLLMKLVPSAKRIRKETTNNQLRFSKQSRPCQPFVR